MWSMLQSVGGFVDRNRTKIIVASAIAIGVSVYLYYDSTLQAEADARIEPQQKEEPLRLLNDNKVAIRNANRARLLVKIRKQFDFAACQFLPTLRVKIVEVVDINGTVRHIKELRMHATSNQEELEARLWNEIKNASFTMLLVTAYMLSAVCTLLRIQLSILARSLYQTYEHEDTDIQLNSEMFHALIEGTYKQLFGSGLRQFTEMVKLRVSTDLAGWTVKDKLHVEYEELAQMLATMRRNLEADMEGMIKTIFIPAEADVNGSAVNGNASNHTTASNSEGTVQNLLNQTWDVLESPAFSTVYGEGVDTCFKLVQDSLHKAVFAPPAPASPGHLRAPPLASILPQVKAIATKLLPTTVMPAVGDCANALSADVKAISSGPYLESFCIAIFDTPVRV